MHDDWTSDIVRRSGQRRWTASTPRSGYVIGNIQWVHKLVNIMKRELSMADFIGVCGDVVRYQIPLT